MDAPITEAAPLINAWTVFAAILIALVTILGTVVFVYTAANLIPHAIISIRKAKRHPMGYRTGGGVRQRPASNNHDESTPWLDKEPAGKY